MRTDFKLAFVLLLICSFNRPQGFMLSKVNKLYEGYRPIENEIGICINSSEHFRGLGVRFLFDRKVSGLLIINDIPLTVFEDVSSIGGNQTLNPGKNFYIIRLNSPANLKRVSGYNDILFCGFTSVNDTDRVNELKEGIRTLDKKQKKAMLRWLKKEARKRH